MMEDDDEFDSEAGGPNGLGLKNLHPRFKQCFILTNNYTYIIEKNHTLIYNTTMLSR